MAHRLAQDVERATWDDAWGDSDLVFTWEDGSGWHPEVVTKRFIAAEAGLRPVRLHDLRSRSGAADARGRRAARGRVEAAWALVQHDH